MKRFDGNINIKTDDVNIKRGWIPVSNVNLPSVTGGVLLSSYPLLPWLIINSASTLHTAMYVRTTARLLSSRVVNLRDTLYEYVVQIWPG